MSIVLGFLFSTLSSVCQAHFIVFHTKIPQIEIHPIISHVGPRSLPHKHLLIHYSMRI